MFNESSLSNHRSALLEISALANGIVQYAAANDASPSLVVSPRVFDAVHEVLVRLSELREEGVDTTETLTQIYHDLDSLPFDVARRQKVIAALVEGVRAEIAANGKRIERKLVAWRADGAAGGPDVGRKIVAEAQMPLYVILTGLMQRPEVSIDA